MKCLATLILGLAGVPLSNLHGQTAERRQHSGDDYQNITTSGAWCWFSDPRAVYHQGKYRRTYVGWVNHRGDVVIGAYDHPTGRIETFVLHEKLEADDHVNPSILIRADGRLMVFYSQHSTGDSPIQLRVSREPEEITGWEPARALVLNNTRDYPKDYRDSYCYSNPYQLSKENGRIFLFWRGMGFKPNVAVSADGGMTWTGSRILIHPDDIYRDRRPYLKVDSNGRDRIHLAFTDGHPRDEPTNSIYYACYRRGAFYKADGTKIADLESLPMKPEQTDRVYDARATQVRAWIWDVAEDKNGRPVLVYARLPSENDHRYHYARWDGKRWVDHEIVIAGQWFPKTPPGQQELEPHYSGGLVLDHNNPDTVYLSRQVNGVFEVEDWSTRDLGRIWTSVPITQKSLYDNVRPFVIRHHKPGEKPSLLWMQNQNYIHYTNFKSSLKMDKLFEQLSSDLQPRAIVEAMRRVADWQVLHPSGHPSRDWTQGALYAGMMAWARMAPESTYLEALIEIGDLNNWQLGDRRYHADDHCVGQTYLDLYARFKDPRMLDAVRERFDWILANPAKTGLQFDTPGCLDRWCWCDALFMSPPLWAKLAAITGERKYLEFMNKEFWATTEFLYDREENLYYRDSRYFSQREASGRKVFWSRGNGWVIAGIARVLESLPADYPERPKYVELFKAMAGKLVKLQGRDGLWRASLLDPDAYPAAETSGTGFHCYAMAWGINQHLLERDLYLPAVLKAWKGLVNSVLPDGKLGWVQPIGADPRKVSAEQTEVYGVGAFLLAGSEMYKIAQRKN
jgi:rhamnogalacturonyl hydrolase YesR